MAKRRMTGGIPAAALQGDPAAAGGRQTAMSKIRPRIARGELVTLPLYGEVWMQIIGSQVMEEIEAATFRQMEAHGLPPVMLHLGTYNLHRFRRILAHAVRDAKNHDEQFGTLDEWAEEPDTVLAAGIALYKDTKARLDPTTSAELSDEDAAEILDAFKKKDSEQLRSFGSATLVTWLLSGAVQLSNSPTPSSKSSDSSQE